MQKALILVLDKSGSMGSLAELKNSTEESTMTCIQLQSHSCNTVIKSVNEKLPRTPISVITFDSDVMVLQNPTNNYDLKDLCEKIASIEDGSKTNMWGAIEMAINFANQLISQQFFVEIFLFTDGAPTSSTNPPRGIISELKKIIPKQNCVINTFGIGSDIDSNLLYNIASIGNGIFKYISDAGMVGTCIINSACRFILNSQTEFNKKPIPIFSDLVTSFGNKNGKQFTDDDIKEIRKEIKNIPKSHPIYLDMEQIQIACSTLNFFQTWGGHYYRTLKSSHEYQHCGNFKDAGLQGYADTETEKMQTILENIFKGVNPNDKNMDEYVNPGGGCVHENDLIVMADGSFMAIGDLKREDKIKSSHGKVGIVAWVLICSGVKELLSFPQGLNITPWHPIIFNGEWQFPNNCSSYSKINNSDNVVTIALKDSDTYSFFIGNIECIALNHGIKNNKVLEHDFYGTNKIIDYIKSLASDDDDGKVYDTVEKRQSFV